MRQDEWRAQLRILDKRSNGCPAISDPFGCWVTPDKRSTPLPLELSLLTINFPTTMAQRMLGEQPDMAELSRHFSGIAVQVERFNNLPAFADGDRIVQAMQDMTQQIRAEIQNVRAEILRDVRTEIQSVRGTLQAYDANASARLINNHKVRAPTHEIEPLVDVRNGAAIPHFPETINQLMDLERMSLVPF